jgi:hypothetical protein
MGSAILVLGTPSLNPESKGIRLRNPLTQRDIYIYYRKELAPPFPGT